MNFNPELEREALTEAERRWLSDLGVRAEQGLPLLASRLVSDVSVSDAAWTGTWSNALLERVTFVDCSFRDLDFRAAALHDVTFERCRFERCGLDGTVFQACRFVACTLSELTSKQTALHECMFEECALSGLTLYEARFDGVHMQGGSLSQLRLSECQVHFWELTATVLESVRLTLCEVGRIALSECESDKFAIVGGIYGSFELSAGKLTDLSFAQSKLGTLRLSELTDATRVRINQSTVRLLLLERCTISDLYIWSTQLERLSIACGAYEGWITECAVGSGSRIEDAELRSFFWDGTRTLELTFSRVALRRFLCARAAQFIGMKLDHVRYLPGFELDLEGAHFEHSDRFTPFPEDDRGP